MKKLLFSWDELKSTFWFFPVLIILIAILLAFTLIYIDSVSTYEPGKMAQYLLTGSTDSARRVLSIISAAMIGVAGTVFSITLVALSLASSQFGPRLLKNFMYDRINQVVLGTYISTFIYCLIVLNSIKGNEQFTFIPSFSVLFALVAAVANIVLLIIFIHHIAVGIQADTVISNISESLSGNVKHLFPQGLGKTSERDGEKDEKHLKKNLKYHASLKAYESGYLRYIDSDSLFQFTTDKNSLIELYFRPGDYLVEGMEIGVVYSDKIMDDDEQEKCNSWFLTGKERTPHQDTEYSIHQMVEIASRALSPGINDPYTAIACIDNLTSTMCYLSGIEFPSKFRYDDEGNLRVIVRPLTYEGILDAAFNQIRQFGKAVPSVAVRLMEALIVIDQFAKTQQHKYVIRKHARMVLNMAEKSFEEPNDLEDLKKRSRQILAAN
jgi:uncharacterized membrane protein